MTQLADRTEPVNETTDASTTVSDGRAGIFTVIALFLLLCGWMWLKSYSWVHAPQRFSVLFHHVAGLNNNAAASVNGVRVGSVEKMQLQGHDKVLVGLKINGEDVVIPQGAKFSILPSGLVGAKYVEIALPVQNEGEKIAALNEKSVVVGEDPVRVELVMNKIATDLQDFDLRASEARLNRHMASFARAADKVSAITDQLSPAASNARDVERKIGDLAIEMKGTSHRLNRLLDNPMLSSDLKQTAQKAKETAESIRITMHELNTTLADKPLRQDLLDAMGRLNDSTIHVQKSVEAVQQITGDKDLRADVRRILTQVNDSMDKADRLLGKPGFGSDLKGTLSEVRQTIGHLDLAAVQINQILDKKHPLVHLLFGRPGSIKDARKVEQEEMTAKSERVENAQKPAGTESASDPATPTGADGQKVRDTASTKTRPTE